MTFSYYFFCLQICLVLGEYKTGSIVRDGGKLVFKPEITKENALAYGAYNDTVLENGWGVLDVSASVSWGGFSAQEVMYAAGMLEGILTAKRIDQHYKNMHSWALPTFELEKKVCKFFADQEEWTIQQIKKHPKDPIWIEAGYIQMQLNGLIDGFNMANQSTGRCPLQVLNGIGEIIDLRYALQPQLFPDVKSMTPNQLKLFVQTSGHCSAIVKITPGFEDLFMGHSSWFLYNAMLRIYKNYDFQLYKKHNPNGKISFSSYPAFLVSLDDFYMLGSKMVMLQTTNNVFNKTLYELVKPQSLFAWQRVRISHSLATSGAEWGRIFSQYNSGTYNNQYMIIDLKKFIPGKELQDGALYVVEQIPGYVEYADQTEILRAGYWPSYNVPFYEKIYNMSGYPAVAANNTDNTYALAPRAKIFRRDQTSVKSLQGIKDILRYNDYKHDIYSAGDPCNAICCRGDLDKSPMTDGCYDTKVTSYQMALNLKSHAISGPTLGYNLPPFSWTPFVNSSHIGMPEMFDFDFIEMKPKFP